MFNTGPIRVQHFGNVQQYERHGGTANAGNVVVFMGLGGSLCGAPVLQLASGVSSHDLKRGNHR